MAHETATVIVDRPIGEVFGFLADGMNEPVWRPGVTDVSHVAETGTAVGAPGHRSDLRSALRAAANVAAVPVSDREHQ